MPESKKRKKNNKPVVDQSGAIPENPVPPSPAWWPKVMVLFLVLGLVWVLVTYLFSGQYPIPGLGNWNLFIGFGIAMIGVIMAFRWR